jgi:hypothetical protein
MPSFPYSTKEPMTTVQDHGDSLSSDFLRKPCVVTLAATGKPQAHESCLWRSKFWTGCNSSALVIQIILSPLSALRIQPPLRLPKTYRPSKSAANNAVTA